MNLLTKLKKALIYDAVIDDPDRKIYEQIWEDNRKFSVIWSLAQIVYWGFCLLMTLREERFLRCRNVYVVTLLISVISLILAAFVINRLPRLINVVKSLISGSILVGGLFIAWILLQTNDKTIMIFASALIVPTLFVNNTLTNILTLTIHIAASAVILRFGLSHDTYIWCLTDLIIFSSIGVTLGHFVNKARFERYVFAQSAFRLAESNAKLAELQTRYAYFDQLTGLQNRRAYSEKIWELTENMPEFCCVIMADINGLKEMNDSRGHEAGDELIIGSAECLRFSFDGIETIYRLGGDEFCVIVTDSDNDVEKCLKRLDEVSAAWNDLLICGISISYGFASISEFPDIRTVLRTADQRMYASKKDYYSAVGISSNRRQMR